jgi:hypothetical protein
LPVLISTHRDQHAAFFICWYFLLPF